MHIEPMKLQSDLPVVWWYAFNWNSKINFRSGELYQDSTTKIKGNATVKRKTHLFMPLLKNKQTKKETTPPHLQPLILEIIQLQNHLSSFRYQNKDHEFLLNFCRQQ